jgi:predicted nucleic acid-binding protein
MSNKNLELKNNLKFDSIDGIIDTGIIVIAHFENPIREDMLIFLRDILKSSRKILIPLTTFVGAYHILTQYLKVDRYNAKKNLTATLALRYDWFFEDISKNTVVNAIDYASVNNIESWDAYLIALAMQFNTRNIYSIDMKLRKLPGFSIINPISEPKFRVYQEFIKKLFEKKQ